MPAMPAMPVDTITRRELLAQASVPALASGSRRFIKGICAALFPPSASYLDCMKQAKSAGFDAVELRLGTNGIPFDCTPDAARRAGDAAAEMRIEIASLWALTPGSPSLASPKRSVSDEAHSRVRKAIELAPALRCGAILVTPAVLGRGPVMETTSDDAWTRSTAAFREFLPEAARSRVLLTPENVWSRFLVSPRDMRAFVDQFQSNSIAVHFDVGNTLQYGYPEDWIASLGARIRRLHLKDYKLSSRASQGGFAPLLEGDVQWSSVMAALSKAGYRGYVTAETAFDNSDPGALRKVSRAMDTILEMA
ncbi:MAG: sugar phosphate isomerase/epimerase family protein [Bryobacteraceae bacterium]